MAKRHRWNRQNGWAVCEDCHVRYSTGMLTKSYEWPNGMRSDTAGICAADGFKHTPNWEIWKEYYEPNESPSHDNQ